MTEERTFEITLKKTTEYFATVEVEATSATAAKKAALEQLDGGPVVILEDFYWEESPVSKVVAVGSAIPMVD